MTTRYLPTINGRPARFAGRQLIYVCGSLGRGYAVLLESRAEVMRQIEATVAYRSARGFPCNLKYGYVRVRVAL